MTRRPPYPAEVRDRAVSLVVRDRGAARLTVGSDPIGLRMAIAPAAPCLSVEAQTALKGVVQSPPSTVTGAVVNGAMEEVLGALAAESGASWLTDEGEGAKHILDYLMRDRDR